MSNHKATQAQKLPGFLFGTKLRILITSVVLLVASASLSYALLRVSLPVTVEYTKAGQSIDQPITVKLNQNLASIAIEGIKITPQVDGQWQHNKGSLFSDDKIIFKPTTDLKVATKYKIEFPKAKRYTMFSSYVPKVEFETEKAPGISEDTKLVFSKSQSIPADYTVAVSLARKNKNLRKLVLRAKPNIDMKMSIKNDQVFSWQPTQLLPQGKKIELEVYDQKNGESLLKKKLKVADEPTVTSYVKQSYFDDKDNAEIIFSQPIDKQSSKNIIFDLEGDGRWKTDRIYQFKPTKLKPAKTYSYTIKKGLRSSSGGIMIKPKTGHFNTTGAARVIGASPRGSGLSQASQTIKFTFDQPVVKPSAEERLKLTSGKLVSTSWQGNTLFATVKNIGYQKNFSATIAAGVKNAKFGLPSTQSYTVNFTTEARTIKLKVPYYAQQHSATCAVASLRMVLASRGINTSEMSIVGKMGYKPRSMDKKTKPPTWDDPSQMFVGSVDGYIRSGTGAGPDAPPVAKAAQAYGRRASAVTGVSTSWMAQQIHSGNPVVMFGATSNTSNISWKTKAGKKVIMNATSHATVIYGVAGEPDQPLGFYVHDPLRGSSYWSVGEVTTNIARDAHRQAVVVY